MIKRHFFLIATVVAVIVMVIAVILRLTLGGGDAPGGGGGMGRGGGGGQQVSEAVAEPREFSNRIQALGVARGIRSVNVTSSTTELITKVLFEDGQRVTAGAPLVELLAREEDASIIEARAQVLQAQRQYDRYKTLADRGIAPTVMAEQAETSLASAQASLQAAQARRGDRVIRAPFSGTVGLTTITPGTLINPGAVITTLDDTSSIRVDFPLPERYLNLVSAGTPLTVSADGQGNEAFQGRIEMIDTRVNEATRSATVRAVIPNPGGRIRPGTMMRVNVMQGLRQAPAVPESAVQFEGVNAFVYRIATTGEGQTAQRVEVVTGVVEGGFVEVLSGLTPGDRIVASGLNRIQAGSKISTGAPNKGGARPGAAAAGAASR